MEYNQQKLSLIRRYPIETLVTFLLTVNAALAYMVTEKHKEFTATANRLESFLNTKNEILVKAIENNTKVLDRVANQLEKTEKDDLH